MAAIYAWLNDLNVVLLLIEGSRFRLDLTYQIRPTRLTTGLEVLI